LQGSNAEEPYADVPTTSVYDTFAETAAPYGATRP
jgi:hypothetical protein